MHPALQHLLDALLAVVPLRVRYPAGSVGGAHGTRWVRMQAGTRGFRVEVGAQMVHVGGQGRRRRVLLEDWVGGAAPNREVVESGRGRVREIRVLFVVHGDGVAPHVAAAVGMLKCVGEVLRYALAQKAEQGTPLLLCVMSFVSEMFREKAGFLVLWVLLLTVGMQAARIPMLPSTVLRA